MQSKTDGKIAAKYQHWHKEDKNGARPIFCLHSWCEALSLLQPTTRGQQRRYGANTRPDLTFYMSRQQPKLPLVLTSWYLNANSDFELSYLAYQSCDDSSTYSNTFLYLHTCQNSCGSKLSFWSRNLKLFLSPPPAELCKQEAESCQDAQTCLIHGRYYRRKECGSHFLLTAQLAEGCRWKSNKRQQRKWLYVSVIHRG